MKTTLTPCNPSSEHPSFGFSEIRINENTLPMVFMATMPAKAFGFLEIRINENVEQIIAPVKIMLSDSQKSASMKTRQVSFPRR